MGSDTTEEERLRRQVMELEEQVRTLLACVPGCHSDADEVSAPQVRLLRLSLATDHRQRAAFIEQSSRNSRWLLSLRHDLSQSLDAVSRHPVPALLESETQRLDRSLREEELKMSLSQS